MFSYRQGKIVSVLGLIPLKFANRYTSIKLMGQVPFNYCQQNFQVNSFDIWLDGRGAPCNAAARAEKSFVSKSARDWDEFFGNITRRVI